METENESNKIKKQNAMSKNNAIFVKLIEILMNKVHAEIVTTRKQYLNWAIRPTFKEKKNSQWSNNY